MKTPWTEPARTRLIELYNTGDSAAVIADQLHCEGLITVSRNAVIGMAHRLALAKRHKGPTHVDPEKIKARSRAKYERQKQRRALLAPPEHKVKPMDDAMRERLRSETVQPHHISLQQLDSGTCHFPYGDWPPYTFCGRKTLKGLSYCAHHAALCGVRGKLS